MHKFKITRYYVKKAKGKKRKSKKQLYYIYAHVRKYRFGFLVDFWDEILDGKNKCHHESNKTRYLNNMRQLPVVKKEALLIIKTLKNAHN